MKALVVLGSPRVNMNTDILLEHVIKGLKSQNVEVEKVELVRLKFDPCISCNVCGKLDIVTKKMT